MKHNDDYRSSSIWYREKIKDPYQVIAEFFSCASISSHRKTIKDVLISISKNSQYSKDSPGDLLFEFKLIESVINSAYLINQTKAESPLEISPAGALNKNLYCGRHSDISEWEDFPRSLSLKEYINPYLVFRQFFKYRKLKEWKKDMEEILEFALAESSYIEGGLTFDVLSIYVHLTKLIEAAHLIDVREITHVGGHLKTRR